MNSNRIWVIGSVVVIIGLLVATWFLGVSPQLALAAQSTIDRVGVDSQNQAQQLTLSQLKKDFDGIDGLKAELNEAREVVPNEKSQAGLIAQIGTLAKRYKVTVENLDFADPLAYEPGDSTDPDVVASMPSVTTGNFFVVPMALSLRGDYGKIMSLIDELQHGTRLVLVTDLALDEGEAKKSSEVLMSVSGETYILLAAADVPVPVSTEAPVDGATPEVTPAQ